MSFSDSNLDDDVPSLIHLETERRPIEGKLVIYIVCSQLATINVSDFARIISQSETLGDKKVFYLLILLTEFLEV